MFKTKTVYQVDSFTTTPFEGNPAGVVSDATGLSDSDMQTIAREMNCSETAFIFPEGGPDYDLEVRFFTPTQEVPVCGHATIAAQYAHARERGLTATTPIRQKTKAGILPIQIRKQNDDYEIVMTQNRPEFGTILGQAARDAFCRALGISNRDLNASCPLQVVSTGHAKMLLAVKTRAILNSLVPDFAELRRLSQEFGYFGLCVFTLDSPDPDIMTFTRMIAPELGIHEYPVTGMAQGPLGAYLLQHRLVPHGADPFVFHSRQGEAIGRPGTVKVTVTRAEHQPLGVSIMGRAVIVLQGTLGLPTANGVGRPA